ncbi:MAG: thiaminase II [Deltaproteobacteria bacterium]|jgi:thiaminase/transcriptional activator TenA|nr:thiaminase II [Deltaproteobacteria bacterium]
MSDKTDSPPAETAADCPSQDIPPFAAVAPFKSQPEPASAQTPWSLDAWRAAAPILEKILAHPFVTTLMDGTLPRQTFLFYISQDALYMADYGRILAAAALKAPRAEDAGFLCEAALTAVKVEGELHEGYLKGETRTDVQTPACLLYTSFLHRHLSLSPFSTIMASVLPCFWIYLAVGRHLLSLAGDSPENPYRDWIDTYGGEDFAIGVERAIRICDRLAAGETPEGRKDMLEAFLAASRMEWMFWDSAYRAEAWPV